MPKTSRINLVVAADVKKSLEQMALERSYRAKLRITLSDLLREALDDYVARAGDVPAQRRVAEDRARYGAEE